MGSTAFLPFDALNEARKRDPALRMSLVGERIRNVDEGRLLLS